MDSLQPDDPCPIHVERIEIEGGACHLVKLRETFENDTHIVIAMDAFTPSEVIRINERNVFMHSLYNGMDSGKVNVDLVGCAGTCKK